MMLSNRRLHSSPIAKSGRLTRTNLKTIAPLVRPAASSDSAPVDIQREISSAVVRVGSGIFMIHNGLDKLADPEGFAKFVVEPYLHLPMPVLWTYAAAAAELAGAAGLIVGLLTRLSSLSLFSTMAVAIYFHLQQTGLQGFPFSVVEKHAYEYELCALYTLIYFYFVVNGGGILSLDALLFGKKKE